MNTYTHNITSLTSQYGVSDSLKAMFEGLRETPGLQGDKFRQQDVNKFAQYIVCRNYGKVCLELSYLLFSIVNYSASSPSHTYKNSHKGIHPLNQPNALLSFFWINENFSPASFRQYFTVPYQNKLINISLTKTTLTIGFDKKFFNISPTRVGVLAVLFEFLIMIKPALIEKIDTLFRAEGAGESAIKTLSSALQKIVYEFLAEHLTNAQTQRRFRFITQWLASKNEHNHNKNHNNTNINAYDEQFLTNEIVLEFWQMASVSDTSLSFKLYSSALNDLIGVDNAFKQTQHMFEVEQSLSVGDSEQAGELSADVLYQQVFELADNDGSLDFLIEDPKFLTKTQWQLLKPYVEHKHYHKKLALSFARQAVFSQWQSSIVQAKRVSPEQLMAKLNALPTITYQDIQQDLWLLHQDIKTVLKAIFYIYLQLQVSEGITGVLSLLSTKDINHIKQALTPIIALMQSATDKSKLDNMQLFNAFNQVLEGSSTLQNNVHDCKKAFKQNNKVGFKTIPHACDLDKYREGQSALARCQQILLIQKQCFTALWQNEEQCQENFRSDTFIFKQSFEKIYDVGEKDDNQ